MDFYGNPLRTIENEFLRLDYMEKSGPRVLGLYLKGHAHNLFADAHTFIAPTQYGDYYFWGGHRLWHAPEDIPRTYIPDDHNGIRIEELADGVRLLPPVEAPTGIRKEMELHLLPGKAQVRVRHVLINEGHWAVDLAPWAITQMALGGVALIPQQDQPKEDAKLPDRSLVLWPYTRLQDERLHLADDYIVVEGKPGVNSSCKIGVRNPQGWLAYLKDEVLFVKQTEAHLENPHFDFGCNTEIYVDHRFLELETIGAMVHLEPGASVEHVENWTVTTCPQAANTPAGIRQVVKNLKLK